MRSHKVISISIMLGMLLFMATPAQAATNLWNVDTQISQNGGTPGNGVSYSNSDMIVNDSSSDGRYVVYESTSTNLTSDNDTNNASDIFLYDRQANTTSLITKNIAGTDTANGASRGPAISADGEYIVFRSFATDLTTDTDTNNDEDIYLYTRSSGEITLVSSNVAGDDTADAFSTYPNISADGSKIIFRSPAKDLTSDTITSVEAQLFIYDRVSATTTLLTRNLTGDDGVNGDSDDMAFSANGEYLVFRSVATDLTNDTDTNGLNDIFLYNFDTDTFTRITRNEAGNDSPNGESQHPVISADGSLIAFYSEASDIVAGDINGDSDIYLYNRNTDSYSIESVDTDGNSLPGALQPFISENGRWLGFGVFSGPNPGGYIRDLQNSTTQFAIPGGIATQYINGTNELLVFSQADFGDLSSGGNVQIYLASFDGDLGVGGGSDAPSSGDSDSAETLAKTGSPMLAYQLLGMILSLGPVPMLYKGASRRSK